MLQNTRFTITASVQ